MAEAKKIKSPEAGPECALCEFIMKELDSILGDNATKVCGGVGGGGGGMIVMVMYTVAMVSLSICIDNEYDHDTNYDYGNVW